MQTYQRLNFVSDSTKDVFARQVRVTVAFQDILVGEKETLVEDLTGEAGMAYGAAVLLTEADININRVIIAIL